MANILIIDDDKILCDMMSRRLSDLGHDVVYALTLREGIIKAATTDFDIVFLDVHLPDGNGLKALPNIKEVPSTPEVIIFTGEGDPDGAELAITSGAWDYIEKPLSLEQMMLSLVRSLQYREEKKRRGEAKTVLKRDGIIGTSPQLAKCLDLAARAANSASNVLITGETGTGKELFARAIHQNSSRFHKNFVVVDCTAIPTTLVESILFGNVKGVYTGASKTREGLVEQADEGTLFLDEVGELPFIVQKSFLRVIQERQILPIGGKKEIKVDFRLIAATNQNLDEMVQNNQFRSDLLFRLRAHKIELPPLRKRKTDIKELLFYYINKTCESHGAETKGFSPEFLEMLMAYEWPGNIRELFNTLEEVLSDALNEPTLFPYHVPTYIRANVARTSLNTSNKYKDKSPSVDIMKNFVYENFPTIKGFRNSMESQYLQKLIQLSDGRKKKACRLSGLSRTRLFELLKKHNISS
jgi:two-component system NtrC family response regulator